jgi:hypothetical protein
MICNINFPFVKRRFRATRGQSIPTTNASLFQLGRFDFENTAAIGGETPG